MKDMVKSLQQACNKLQVDLVPNSPPTSAGLDRVMAAGYTLFQVFNEKHKALVQIMEATKATSGKVERYSLKELMREASTKQAGLRRREARSTW